MYIEPTFATPEECFMMKEDGMCHGGIMMIDRNGKVNCGLNCPFIKTEAEQRAIEQKLVRRFESGAGVITRPYQSCVDGKILYDPLKYVLRRHMY